MNSVKVSVLMPIYNTDEIHLREAISSILEQSYTDFEFLILNDSPDNTQLDELVASFEDSRIRYYKNEKNSGITPSRNRLMKLARGEYFAVMDHDDISLPDRFAKQVDILDRYAHVGVVSSWVDTLFGDQLHFPQHDSTIKTMLMDICPVVHPASMIRRSILERHQISYQEEYSPAEDFQLWCRLIEHTQFYNIQEVLFLYRDHLERTSNTQRQKMLDATNRIHAETRAKHRDIYDRLLLIKNKYPSWYDRFITISQVSNTGKRSQNVAMEMKLFSFIPFIKVIAKGRKKKIYLFGFIPLLSYKGRF